MSKQFAEFPLLMKTSAKTWWKMDWCRYRKSYITQMKTVIRGGGKASQSESLPSSPTVVYWKCWVKPQCQLTFTTKIKLTVLYRKPKCIYSVLNVRSHLKHFNIQAQDEFYVTNNKSKIQYIHNMQDVTPKKN